MQGNCTFLITSVGLKSQKADPPLSTQNTNKTTSENIMIPQQTRSKQTSTRPKQTSNLCQDVF